MSSPPRYHSELPAIPTDSYRSRTPATSLPPGAMEPGVPGGPPPVPTRINVDNYHDQRQTSYRAPPPLPKPPTTAPAMNEFGANYPSPSSTHLSAHSSVRRPLPSQPPNGPPSYSPPSYPQPSASGPASLGRRSLPKPPSASQSSTPLPPPRPSARTLPAVPPTASYNQTSTGYTAPPPVSPLPSRPQAGARTFDSAPLALPNDPVVGGDRLNETERVRYDSPANITPVESGSHPSAGPSRAPSQSYSLYTSSVNTHDTTSTAPYSDQSTETTATSIPSQDSGYAAFRSLYDPDSKLDEPDEGGTNVTLRPPSRAHLGVSEHASEDGRRTPTLANWTDDLEPPNLANLHIERRPRTTSQTTIGAVDAGLPSTPTSAPHRMLHHQRSLLDESSSSSAPRDVYFPVPHLSVPHSAADGSSSSQQSMYSNRSTPYGSDVSLPIHSQRSSPASFPEAGQSAPRRQSSQASSMRPSIASSDRRISAALSPSWQAIAQPPSSWVQTKLQIHQSHVDGEEYYDDDGSLRRDSAYEDDIINEYGEEEDEDVEEVNEIRFFQPSFLSEAALQLRDRVQRSRQMKAGIAWVGSFTGRDIVVCHSCSSAITLADFSEYHPKLSARLHQRFSERSPSRSRHGAVVAEPALVCRGRLGYQTAARLVRRCLPLHERNGGHGRRLDIRITFRTHDNGNQMLLPELHGRSPVLRRALSLQDIPGHFPRPEASCSAKAGANHFDEQRRLDAKCRADDIAEYV